MTESSYFNGLGSIINQTIVGSIFLLLIIIIGKTKVVIPRKTVVKAV